MATIRSQMVLNDGISGVLMKMNRALNTTLNAFEQVQRASGRAVDATQIQAARAALVQANNEVEQMAEGYRRAAEQEEVLNRGLRNGNSAAGGLLGKVKGIVATLAAGAGLKALTGLSDKLTSTTARLSFMVDDGGSVDALEQKIMASAQRSRSYYLDTASAIASMALTPGGLLVTMMSSLVSWNSSTRALSSAVHRQRDNLPQCSSSPRPWPPEPSEARSLTPSWRTPPVLPGH